MQSKTKTVLSFGQIEALVRANFGEQAALGSVTELTEGFFNAVYALKLKSPVDGYDELVLKVGIESGKHVLTYEKDILRTELFVYETLAKTEVPVPRVQRSDCSRSLLDCDYFFMEKLSGQTWDRLKDTLRPENSERLQYDLGRYSAIIHSIKGNYFGYIKDDDSYRFPTWRQAFRSFVDNVIADGRSDGVQLPYDEILAAFEPHWPLLDAVTEPRLVNYDIWDKNILLKEQDGQYVIEGIIDHERAFYGDPLAEFISTSTICGELEKAEAFRKGYSELLPFNFGREEQLRYWMYNVYMGLLIGVEIYRYEDADIPMFLEMSRYVINQGLEKLKALG